MITRLLAAVVLFGCLSFVAVQSCGPDSDSESPLTPVAELGCDDLVCTLLVWNASEVRVYDDEDQYYHRWSDYPGYLDGRRLTYRFPLPISGIVIAEACNPDGVCVEETFR